MIGLSPGLAQGCFELLRFSLRNAATFTEIRSSFPYIGGIDCSRVIETAQALKWLRLSECSIAEITPSGARLIGLTNYEWTLRQALLDYIDIERPAWIQNATYGRARVLAFAGNEIAQVFVEAGLASDIEEDVVAFWDMLAARARGQKNDLLTMIGRRGERQTLLYEERRTNHRPKWISVDENADGYDVLSIVEAEDLRPLSIEVKASSMGLDGTFYLTRNEWERALAVESHVFHLWNLRNHNAPAIAIVTPEEMQRHIPDDCGSGSWELVEVSLAVFQDRFVSMVGQGY